MSLHNPYESNEKLIVYANEVVSSPTVNRGVNRLLANDNQLLAYTDILASASGQILISSTDSTPGYIYSKLLEGTNVTFSKESVGTVEYLRINSSGGGGGGGDVYGPASSVAGDICEFNGITGKQIQDSGISAPTLRTLVNGGGAGPYEYVAFTEYDGSASHLSYNLVGTRGGTSATHIYTLNLFAGTGYNSTKVKGIFCLVNLMASLSAAYNGYSIVKSSFPDGTDIILGCVGAAGKSGVSSPEESWMLNALSSNEVQSYSVHSSIIPINSGQSSFTITLKSKGNGNEAVAFKLIGAWQSI